MYKRQEDIRASGHIIRGRNAEGDFEVYKYGARIEQIQNGAPAVPDAGDYYALTQSEYRPVSYTHLDVYKRQGLQEVSSESMKAAT